MLALLSMLMQLLKPKRDKYCVVWFYKMFPLAIYIITR